MPYYISDKQSGCSGWATLKVVGGEPTTISCHPTKTAAVKHMVALSLAENIAPAGEFGKRAESYKPPMGVRIAAKRALAWIADGKAGSGFTDVGRARASQLAAGESVSSDTISRMKSYFARHEVDKKATGFRAGEDGYPSPGRVAWDAWGGDSGKSWVNGLADGRDLRKAGGKKAVIVDIDDTLIHAGRRIDKTYNYIESLDVDVLLVTGRPESTRDTTTKQLADLDISYNRLYMNPGSSANSNAFKKAKAEELLKTYDIIEAIENNPDARRGYADLGIPTKDPAKLPMMKHQDTVGDNEDQPQRNIMTDAQIRATSRAEKIMATLRKINGIKPEAETRVLDVDFEIRAEGDKITFSGYAAVFNSDSHPLPFIERIAPGAFKRSLQARNDVKLLWNHDSSEVLASTRSGTMRLYEDAHGLKVEAEIAPTTRGKDLSILMKRGDINKMSFGFTVQQDSWSPDGNTRTLESVRLIETSIVTFPAYEASVAQVRSLDQIDTDKLSDALLALETSDSLTPDQAGLLENVIKQLTKGEAPVEEVVVEEAPEEPATMIGLLQLKHTLEGKML